MSKINDDDSEDVYRQLQQHLDKMPVGFPATSSGVEIRILKHLFTPDEARIALKLSFIPTSLKKIYRRFKKTGITLSELEEKLDGMVRKGCLNYGVNPKTGEKMYANAFLAIGMYEYQIKRLTREFVEDFEQYIDEAFADEIIRTSVPQLRTIPIGESVVHDNLVATYDDIRQIIETRSPISVTECICRKTKALLGEGCSHPLETCMQFGSAARFYIENGLGREISKEEAYKIISLAESEGLVLQPSNSKRPLCVCCCCGCSCEILSNLKNYPNPADMVASNYYCVIDSDECAGCGTCIDYCQMSAIELDDDVAVVNVQRCIGCGACASKCPNDAIHLARKDNVYEPPENTVELYMRIMEEKAKRARAERERQDTK
ncbi:MAG: 4Fe-4S dicluster domain-containing protein [Promethearchaeota archaeon]